MALGDGGLLSNEGITPQGGGFNLNSLFGGGFGIGSAITPALGAIGGDFNAFGGIGSIIGGAFGGPIGAGIGGLIGGGLGKAFGGGGFKPRPGFSATDLSVLDGTFLEGFKTPGSNAITQSTFGDGADLLAAEIQFISPLIDRELAILNSLGLGSIADQLTEFRNATFNPTPSSQQAGRTQNNKLLAGVGAVIRQRNAILEEIKSDPNSAAEFLSQSGGTSIDDIINKINNNDNLYIGEIKVDIADQLAVQGRSSTISNSQIEIDLASRLNTEHNIRKSGTGFAEFDPNTNEPGRRVSQEEVDSLKAGIRDRLINAQSGDSLSKQTQTQAAFDALPDLPDINPDILSLIGNLPVGENLVNQLAKGGILSADPQQPPPDPQEPPVDDGTGGAVDTLPGEDTFLAQQQLETDLITAQQQDKALQGDESATPDDKKQSALSLLGLTSSFLINSLTNTDGDSNQNTQQQTVTPSAGFSFGSPSSSTIDREANVFKSGIFQPIKQEQFVRPDAPLTRIPESPSSFPLLGEQGQRGLSFQSLRPQNRGLIAN